MQCVYFNLEISHLINIYRWKERFIVLTRDYLQCYKRVVTEASQMGPFISQVGNETYQIPYCVFMSLLKTATLVLILMSTTMCFAISHLPYLVSFCWEKNSRLMSQLKPPQIDK